MSDVLLTEDSGGVRKLTLNRPESFNALNVELKLALTAALREAAADDDVRAVVLAGAGRSFCAGQDLKEHIALLEAEDPSPLRTVVDRMLAEHRTVWSGSGAKHAMFPTSFAELVRITGGTAVDIEPTESTRD